MKTALPRFAFAVSFAGVLSTGSTGCAPAKPAATPTGATASAPVTATPQAPPKVEVDARGVLRREDFGTLFSRPRPIDFPFPPSSATLPKPPASCAAYVHRKAEPAVACGTARATLAEILDDRRSKDLAKLDRQLVALESCGELPAGFVRALRTEIAPPECGDLLVAPLLARPAAGGRGGITPALQHALFGLGIAARLARASDGLPTLAPPFTKPRVTAFVHGPVEQWLHDAATNVEDNARWAAKLEGYGRGVAAVEAGSADLRLVEQMRTVPIPYESKLDEQLEPRAVRGRDAALVGLRDLADVGAFVDPHGERARQLLAKQYAGRRIDALDPLVLPLEPRRHDGNSEALGRPDVVLLSELPTFYASVLRASEGAAGKPITVDELRALLDRGFPATVRAELAKSDAVSDPRLRLLEAEGRLLLARRYWRAVDVDEALRIAAMWTAGTPGAAGAPAAPTTEQLWVGALAQALRGGPDDAAQMMLRPPANGLRLGDRAALDALGASKGPPHGAAQFDSALLMQLTAPPDAGAGYFHSLAERYAAAGAALEQDGRPSDAAKARAEEARSVEKSLVKAPYQKQF
jgi:hypothetical protein